MARRADRRRRLRTVGQLSRVRRASPQVSPAVATWSSRDRNGASNGSRRSVCASSKAETGRSADRPSRALFESSESEESALLSREPSASYSDPCGAGEACASLGEAELFSLLGGVVLDSSNSSGHRARPSRRSPLGRASTAVPTCVGRGQPTAEPPSATAMRRSSACSCAELSISQRTAVRSCRRRVAFGAEGASPAWKSCVRPPRDPFAPRGADA